MQLANARMTVERAAKHAEGEKLGVLRVNVLHLEISFDRCY